MHILKKIYSCILTKTFQNYIWIEDIKFFWFILSIFHHLIRWYFLFYLLIFAITCLNYFNKYDIIEKTDKFAKNGIRKVGYYVLLFRKSTSNIKKDSSQKERINEEINNRDSKVIIYLRIIFNDDAVSLDNILLMSWQK